MLSTIRITKLTRTESGWTANVNGVPVMTLGKSGTMSAWVSKPRRFDRRTHEVTVPVREALVRKVRQAERADSAVTEAVAA